MNGEQKLNKVLSVVVPVYNCEFFLSYCLDSLLSYQAADKGQYEVIMVNDGSTDNSLAIMQSYATSNQNITVINQANAGVSAARNRGMDVAEGKYIWFVDGDDFIKSNCLEAIFEILKKRMDVYHFCGYSFKQVDFNETMINQELKGTSQPDIWTYIFSLSFLRKNNIRFEEGIHYSETQLFVNDVKLNKPYQVSDDKTLYYYRINEFSANRTNIQRKISCYFDLFELLGNRLQDSKYPVENTLNQIISLLEMRFMYAMNDMSIVSQEQFVRGKTISKQVNIFITNHNVLEYYSKSIDEYRKLCEHCESEDWGKHLNRWRTKQKRKKAIKNLKKRIKR